MDLLDEFQEEEAAVFAAQIEADIAANARALALCDARLAAQRQAQAALQSLLAAPRRRALAPVCGGLAYFEADLVHTNDVTVLLGDGWFASRSAAQACATAGRRCAFLAGERETLAAEGAACEQRARLLRNTGDWTPFAAQGVFADGGDGDGPDVGDDGDGDNSGNPPRGFTNDAARGAPKPSAAASNNNNNGPAKTPSSAVNKPPNDDEDADEDEEEESDNNDDDSEAKSVASEDNGEPLTMDEMDALEQALGPLVFDEAAVDRAFAAMKAAKRERRDAGAAPASVAEAAAIAAAAAAAPIAVVPPRPAAAAAGTAKTSAPATKPATKPPATTSPPSPAPARHVSFDLPKAGAASGTSQPSPQSPPRFKSPADIFRSFADAADAADAAAAAAAAGRARALPSNNNAGAALVDAVAASPPVRSPFGGVPAVPSNNNVPQQHHQPASMPLRAGPQVLLPRRTAQDAAVAETVVERKAAGGQAAATAGASAPPKKKSLFRQSFEGGA